MQERISKTLEDTDIHNNFLNRNLIAQQLRERIDKWGYIKLKIFCMEKEILARVKRQSSE
jgi:hypothetical protein